MPGWWKPEPSASPRQSPSTPTPSLAPPQITAPQFPTGAGAVWLLSAQCVYLQHGQLGARIFPPDSATYLVASLLSTDYLVHTGTRCIAARGIDWGSLPTKHARPEVIINSVPAYPALCSPSPLPNTFHHSSKTLASHLLLSFTRAPPIEHRLIPRPLSYPFRLYPRRHPILSPGAICRPHHGPHPGSVRPALWPPASTFYPTIAGKLGFLGGGGLDQDSR